MWTIIFFTCWQCSSFVMGNDDWLSHLSDESQLKCEKSPPKSSKSEKPIFILHSTSDDWPSDPSNKIRLKCKKRSPKSSKNEMFIFGLRSTSDNWLNNLSNESRPKCDKRPPKWSNNEMLIFGLHSTSDDWPCNPSNKSQLKCGKRPPKSLKNEILILYYVQLLMISQAIRVTKVDQNVKKWNIVSVSVFCCLSLGLLYAPLPPRWKGRN